MPETRELLAALRDVGVPPPAAGDPGDADVRSALEREIAGRRRSRRRVSRRAAGYGTAIVAGAAIAAGVVATTGVLRGSHSPVTRTTVRPVGNARETAYIVRRVRARLAHLALTGRGQVLERSSRIGNATAGDPIVRNTDWAYVDPRSGVEYQRSVDRSADGTTLAINGLITTPRHNVVHTRATFVNPSLHAYLTYRDAPPVGPVSAAASPIGLSIKSTARQIDQALRHNDATLQGTATVDGQSTIRLSVPPPPELIRAGLPRLTRITLYVNAKTYRPVEEVEVSPTDAQHPSRHPNTSTSRWLPTTAATIALAQLRIPRGYRHVAGPLDDFWSNATPLFFLGY